MAEAASRSTKPGPEDPSHPLHYAPGPFDFFHSLHFRLMILVFASVLPFLGLVMYSNHERNNDAVRSANRDVQRFARIASRNQEMGFDHARELLEAVSLSPVIQGGTAGERETLLREILDRSPACADIRLATPDGVLLASARPSEESKALADTACLAHAARTGEVAVGNFVVGRTGEGKASVDIARPIKDAGGKVLLVLGVTLDLGWLNQFQRTLQISADSTLQVLSPTAEVLVRLPANGSDVLGKVHPVPILSRDIPLGEDIPIIAEDLDGVRRVFGLAPLVTGGSNRGFLVLVGLPEESVLGPVREALKVNLIWLLIVTGISLGAARVLGEKFVLFRVRGLIKACKRLASVDLKDLRARRRVSQDPSELGDLERSFDLMALHLEERGRELDEKARKLDKS